jgi:DNA-binding PadR family transcriptional regulator
MPTIRENLPTFTVLYLLAQGPHCGLDLVEKSNGVLGRGTIYVLLDKLEERLLISSKLEEVPLTSPPPRRFYSLTDKGRSAYNGYKYDIAKQYRAGYAASIALESLGDDRSIHWVAGWNAGYRARMAAAETLNSYLSSIGCATMEVMTTCAGESVIEGSEPVDSGIVDLPETKEEFYDSAISPIVDQVIELCAEAKIAFVMSFELGSRTDEDGEVTPIGCTSVNVLDDREPYEPWAIEVRNFIRTISGPAGVGHVEGA